jgi:hypothetical protein
MNTKQPTTMNTKQPTTRPSGVRPLADHAFLAAFKQSKLQRGVLSVLLTLGMSGPLHAVPLWDVNFANDTVGQRPATNAATAGVVNTRPTATSVSTGASLLVQESFTAGSAVLSNKPVVFSTPGANVTMSLNGAPADYQAGAFYKLSFDFLIDGAASPSTGAMLQAQMFNTNNVALAKFILLGNGDLRIDTLPVIDGGVFNLVFSNRWQKDTVMSADLLFSPIDNLFTVNLAGASGGPTSASAAIGGNFDDLGVLNLQFGRASSTVGWTGAVDNIIAVPEPRLGALLGLGALLLATHRAIRRRHR